MSKQASSERIGIIAPFSDESDVLEVVTGYGLEVVQINCWDEALLTTEYAKKLRRSADARGIRITSFWAGWPGPKVWDFLQGPETLGIVPAKYRKARVAALAKAGIFAEAAGLEAVVTHLGFIPENPTDPAYAEIVESVRELATGYKALGLEFWFESGQETPVTMRRLIDSVGTGNLGINLDPANLLMYGKANPIDALDILGPYVKSVHVKDGHYPTDPMQLGVEVKVGEGAVCFPKFLPKLENDGYSGAYIIEREIHGAEQERDIRATISYLGDLLDNNGDING